MPSRTVFSEDFPNEAQHHIFLSLALFAASAIAQTATVGEKETGLAAVYTFRLNYHVIFSGQTYDASSMTASHNTLPYGSKIRVTNPKNNKSVVVK